MVSWTKSSPNSTYHAYGSISAAKAVKTVNGLEGCVAMPFFSRAVGCCHWGREETAKPPKSSEPPKPSNATQPLHHTPSLRHQQSCGHNEHAHEAPQCHIRADINWRVPNPPGANPLVAERAPWRSSQSCVTGGQQPIRIPYRFLSFLLHTWQTLCDPTGHSWGRLFQFPGG